jgi:hypothetical protein
LTVCKGGNLHARRFFFFVFGSLHVEAFLFFSPMFFLREGLFLGRIHSWIGYPGFSSQGFGYLGMGILGWKVRGLPTVMHSTALHGTAWHGTAQALHLYIEGFLGKGWGIMVD